MKKFHKSGLKTLMKSLPEAIIVPISINNSWKLAKIIISQSQLVLN